MKMKHEINTDAAAAAGAAASAVCIPLCTDLREFALCYERHPESMRG